MRGTYVFQSVELLRFGNLSGNTSGIVRLYLGMLTVVPDFAKSATARRLRETPNIQQRGQ